MVGACRSDVTPARRRRGLVALVVVGAMALGTVLAAPPSSAAPIPSPPDLAASDRGPSRQVPDERGLRIVRSEPAWELLEVRAREMVAELHGVPNDADLLLSARDEVSAAVFGLLLQIVETPAAERTPEERAAYDALRYRLYYSEVNAAEEAVRQYDRWRQDPCRYQPPHGFTYNRHLACSPLGSLYSSPQPPSAAELMTYGQLHTYPWMVDQATATDASAVLQETAQVSALLAGGVASALTAMGLLATGTATAAYTFFAPFAGKAMWMALSGGQVLALQLPTGVAAAGATTIGFAVGIAVFAVVAAAFELASVIEASRVRPAVDEHLAAAQEGSSPEDVLAGDGGVGRLFAPFYPALLDQGLTVPDVPAPEVAWEPGAGGHRYETSVDGGPSSTGPTFATLGHDGTPQVSYEDADGWLVTRRGGAAPTRSLSIGFIDPVPAAHGLSRSRLSALPDGYMAGPDGTDDSLPYPGPCVTHHPRCAAGETVQVLDASGRPAVVRRIENAAPSTPLITVERASTAEGEPVVLQATASDPEGEPLRYEWQVERPPCRRCLLAEDPGVDRLSGSSVPYVFTDSGTFRVEVTASDPTGTSSSASIDVPVDNVAPTVEATGRGTVPKGTMSEVDVVWRDGGTNDSHQVHIDWGDGTEEAFEHPTSHLFGRGRDGEDGSRRTSATHVYTDGGTYTVTVTVTDDEEASATGATTLEVTSPEPPPPGATAPGAARAVLAWTPADFDNVTWAAFIPPDDGGAPILRYEVTEKDTLYCGEDGPPCHSELPQLAQTLDPGVIRAFAGDYPRPEPDRLMVRAVNAVGPGPWSEVATPTTEDELAGLHPQVAVDWPSEVDEGATVSLTLGEPILAPGRQVASVMWDVGADGTVDSEADAVEITVDGSREELPIEVTVIDDAGWPTTVRHTVPVRNLAPTLAGLEDSATTGEDRVVTLAGTTADPGGDDVEVTIDWGDGAWSSTGGPAEEFTLTHTFATGGRFPVVVTATDSGGATTVHRVTVTAPGVPSPPTDLWYPSVHSIHWQPSASGNADHYVVTIREVVEGEVGSVVETIETTATSVLWEDWTPLRQYEVEVAACSAQGCASAAQRAVTTAPVKWVWVRGRVLLPDGSPAPGQWVRAFAESDEGGEYSGTGGTDGDGRYEMQVLAPLWARFEVTPQPHTPDLRVTWLGGTDRESADLFDVSSGQDLELPDLVMLPLDGEAPAVEITEAPQGEAVEPSATISFTVDDETATVECRLDDGAWEECASPYEVRDLAVGRHTVEVRATDPAGNVGTDDVTWTVRERRPADDAWVIAAHVDLLGREPTPDELADARERLDAGTSRGTIARGLAARDEWLGHVVDEAYRTTLGRAADPTGREYWVDQLRSGRRRVVDLLAQFFASPEHYHGRGGRTDATWVEALYAGALDRTPGDTDTAFWVDQVTRRGRGWVAGQVVRAPEAAGRRVDVLYRRLLGRAAEPGGRSFWAERVRVEGDLALTVHLVASAEYHARAARRHP